MASRRQRRANRENARKSTGPADTSSTRFNGLAHGLTSKQTVIRGESQEAYDTFAADLGQALAPASPVESVLAERVIAAAWRLKCFTRVETSFFNNRIDAILGANPQMDPDAALANLFTDPAEMARMRLFLRYQTAVQREYDTAMRELRKTQAERAEQAQQPAVDDTSQDSEDKDLARAIADLHAYLDAPIGFASHNAPDEAPDPDSLQAA